MKPSSCPAHRPGRATSVWVATPMPSNGNRAAQQLEGCVLPRQRFFAALRMTIWGMAVLGVFVFAGAQTVLPAIAADTAPVAFDTTPARCTIPPRTLDDLERILAQATPVAMPQRPVAGDVIDADSDDGKTVTSTLATLFACLNAGDRLRAYALYTDTYLASILQPGDLPAVATPQPADADEQTQIIAIELHALPEGAVLAKVTLDPALIPVHKIFEFILVPVDGQWRIDRVINEIDFSIP